MSGFSDRWRRWALPLSLSVNVFLATVIVVHEWHRHRGPPDPRHMIEEIARELPEADAAILRRTFAAEPELQREPPQKGKDPMNPVRAALRAEPFDPEALKTAIAGLHHGRDGFDQAM
ncbi:MAG: periplasmic heavy metal sensor, partial [Rhodospirillaceae bacterium]